MKIITYLGYFGRLRSLLGYRAASLFAAKHLLNKVNPPKDGRLASVPVGSYVFYFPSIDYFVGLFTEIFFKETYYLDATKKPIHVIDCGANIGMSLLYIKTRAPRAKVACYEPNPAARAILEKNVTANKWNDDVKIFPYALGKKKKTVQFFVDDVHATSSGGSTAPHQKNKSRGLESYDVEMVPLSPTITSTIDFLKIDIEGGEFDLLEELAASKKMNQVKAVQLEYHYIPGFFTRPLSELLDLLENEGYHTFVESNTPPHRIIGHDTWHTYMVFAWRPKQ